MGNTSFKKQGYNTPNENDHLDHFYTRIISLRKSLFRFSKELPRPLDEKLVTHFNKRLDSASSTPMLGEYAAYIIGDLFNIPTKIVDRLAFPWLLLYEYCLMLDDMIDNLSQYNSHTLLASQLTLQSSIKEYNKIFKNDASLWESFDIYFRQWFDAMLFEVNQKFLPQNKTNNINYLQQGRKAVLVKFCATSLVLLNNRRYLNIDEEKCLDSFCCGIQLLDDITDIEQDYSLGVSNTLVIQINEWLADNQLSSIVNIKNLTSPQLKIALIFSRAISNSLKLAINFLNQGLILASDDKCITSVYFHNLIEECEINIKHIDELLEDVPFDKIHILLSNDEFTKNNIYQIDSERIKVIWDSINSLIYNGPKACN